VLRARLWSILLLAAALLHAQTAGSAELYVSGSLLNSGATGEASGGTDFFDISGEDSDSSPAYGGTLGLAFPMSEAVPLIGSWEVPDWVLRTEVEFLMGRDYELRSDGANSDEFFSEVDAWTVLPSVWLDLPLRRPVSWLFGRVPILELMSVYAGGGVGIANVDLEASDNVSTGKEEVINFAWQAGAGIGYQLTDTTTFTLGWRYLSMGTTEATLFFAPGAKAGDFEMDLTSHEIQTGLRIGFYSAPLADMHPRYWRAPRVPLPGWWPGWLGGPDDEDEGIEDDL
jgi:hypothetical protein